MKFTVERATLVKMIKQCRLLKPYSGKPDHKLRLWACSARVFVEANQVIAGTEALVLRDGTAVVERVKFLKIVQSYTDRPNLTIEADVNGLKVANTTMPLLSYLPQATPPGEFKVYPVADIRTLGIPEPVAVAPLPVEASKPKKPAGGWPFEHMGNPILVATVLPASRTSLAVELHGKFAPDKSPEYALMYRSPATADPAEFEHKAHYGPKEQRIWHHHIPIEIVEEIHTLLTTSMIPAYVLWDMGLDGVTYELRLGDSWGGAVFRWWLTPPKGWEPLAKIISLMRGPDGGGLLAHK